MLLSSVYSSEHDPLALAIAPLSTETAAERAVRLKAEHDAKRRSDRIDEYIDRFAKEEKRRRKATKVLLLGA